MAWRFGNGGKAQCRAVERNLGLADARTAAGTTVFSGDSRSYPAGEMAHGEKSKGLHKDGRKERSAEDGAGEGKQR